MERSNGWTTVRLQSISYAGTVSVRCKGEKERSRGGEPAKFASERLQGDPIAKAGLCVGETADGKPAHTWLIKIRVYISYRITRPMPECAFLAVLSITDYLLLFVLSVNEFILLSIIYPHAFCQHGVLKFSWSDHTFPSMTMI